MVREVATARESVNNLREMRNCSCLNATSNQHVRPVSSDRKKTTARDLSHWSHQGVFQGRRGDEDCKQRGNDEGMHIRTVAGPGCSVVMDDEANGLQRPARAQANPTY